MAKNFLKWALASIVTLAIPVLLWNVWALDYIDQHGKFWAFALAPVFAFLSAGIIVGLSKVDDPIVYKGYISGFWGWFFMSLVIGVVIVLLSNT